MEPDPTKKYWLEFPSSHCMVPERENGEVMCRGFTSTLQELQINSGEPHARSGEAANMTLRGGLHMAMSGQSKMGQADNAKKEKHTHRTSDNQQAKSRSHHSMKCKNSKQQEGSQKNQIVEVYEKNNKDNEDAKAASRLSQTDKKSRKNQMRSTDLNPSEDFEKTMKINDTAESGKDTSEEAEKMVEHKEEKLYKNSQLQLQKKDEAEKTEALADMQYERSCLQLDLTDSHMNNSRKIVSSPQRPHGLKNNMLHDASAALTDITKGSNCDVTSRNLGYQDIEKCHKQLCSQTLDQKQQKSVCQQAHRDTDKSHKTPDQKQSTNKNPSSSPKKKVPPDSNNTDQTSITVSDTQEKLTKESRLSPSWCGDEGEDKVSPDADRGSINTYPSLSELNLNFSSLAAQKILCGATSINSIDTLVEVNLAAQKHKGSKHSESLTSTDFGFL